MFPQYITISSKNSRKFKFVLEQFKRSVGPALYKNRQVKINEEDTGEAVRGRKWPIDVNTFAYLGHIS